MTSPDLAGNKYDEKGYDQGRFYTNPSTHREVPSITNITGMKEKPGIAKWGYRKCGEFVASNLEAINLLSKDKKAIVDLVREAPYRKSEERSEIGDQIHDMIERYIHTNGEEPTEEEVKGLKGATPRGMWKHFLAVNDRYHPGWAYPETTVWSDKYDYAGTLDWMAQINGYWVLGDTKTGNNVYPEVGMQLAALFYADYAIAADGSTFELPKAKRFAVMHTRPRGARLVPIEHIEESFRAFLGLREVFKWQHETSESVVKTAPKLEV